MIVERNFGSLGQVRIGFATSPGTASSVIDNQQDFRAQAGYLTFTQGQTRKTISVGLVNDVLAEGPEDFYVNITTIELQQPM